LPANFGAVVATVVARSNFSSRLPRFDGSRDRLFSSFLALQEGPAGQTFNGGRPGETRAPPASPALTPLGTNRFVEEMSGVCAHTLPFPTAISKKGLQVQMVDDAIALGIKHAAFNVNFSQ